MHEQVSLAPSALAGDSSGVAATISVPGGNKVKMKDGEAAFKNVRIEADAAGTYTLRAKSASRKVRADPMHSSRGHSPPFGICMCFVYWAVGF